MYLKFQMVIECAYTGITKNPVCLIINFHAVCKEHLYYHEI